MSVTKGQIPYDSIYMRPWRSQSHGEEAERRLGAGRRGNWELMSNGDSISVGKMKKFWRWRWWWLHKDANVVSAAGLFFSMV